MLGYKEEKKTRQFIVGAHLKYPIYSDSYLVQNTKITLIFTMSRLSTVYDLGSLRLHPDGTRVAQSSKNLRTKKSTSTVRDARGNWIAKDAAGSTKVAKYVHKKGEESGGEEFDFSAVDDKAEDDEDYELSPPGKRQRKRNPKTSKDSRGSKRRKFIHDIEFLDAITASATEDTSIPLPSSVSTVIYHSHIAYSIISIGSSEMYTSFYEHVLCRTRTALQRIEAISEREEAEEAGEVGSERLQVRGQDQAQGRC